MDTVPHAEATEMVDLPGSSTTVYAVASRAEIHLAAAGEIELRLSGPAPGVSVVIHLDPAAASQLAAALARTVDRTAQRDAG